MLRVINTLLFLKNLAKVLKHSNSTSIYKFSLFYFLISMAVKNKK